MIHFMLNVIPMHQLELKHKTAKILGQLIKHFTVSCFVYLQVGHHIIMSLGQVKIWPASEMPHSITL